ncbi:hypothetical protein Dimus_029602, partial [Dionaea muscipula]
SQWNWGLENINEAAINNKDAEISWERAVGRMIQSQFEILKSPIDDTNSHDQPTRLEVPSYEQHQLKNI